MGINSIQNLMEHSELIVFKKLHFIKMISGQETVAKFKFTYCWIADN